MSDKELLVHAAVALLASGRADRAAEAVSLATQLVAEVERALETKSARAKKTSAAKTKSTARKKTKSKRRGKTRATKAKLLPVRALRVLERIGVVDPEEAPDPRELQDKICEAHLFSAKNCGQATVKQVASWFEHHGLTLREECPTFSEDWLTDRCEA